jgi:EAL domain-containing protein (putative c-di-GMP-specific phosphodiesterase class I)
LIKNIHLDKNAHNIVTLINKFAHDSEIETVAEFVENEEIFLVLQEIGIDYAQGYHFSVPDKVLKA